MRDLRDVLAEHGVTWQDCRCGSPIDRTVATRADGLICYTAGSPDAQQATHLAAVVRDWATSDDAVTTVGKAVLELGPDPTNLRIGFTATRALFGGDPE